MKSAFKCALVMIIGLLFTVYFSSPIPLIIGVLVSTLVTAFKTADYTEQTARLWKQEYIVNGLILNPSESEIIAENSFNTFVTPYLIRLIKTSHDRYVLCEFTLESVLSEPKIKLSIIDESDAKSKCLELDKKAYRINFGEPEKC
ncbi:hypothetical protein AB8I23_004174 [Vibrio alginolyticus]|nr:hypothetical protein [Vibrio parahaemolyticus]EJC7127670.1 hypothetical protein [Vibrio parahaemolyticus]